MQPSRESKKKASSAGPSSTYRLQIHPGFDLDAATGLVDYLAALGVGAVYLSPILRAVEGSTHGYDIADHREIDPARGGDGALRRLCTAAREAGLTVVVDIVPNHAGVGNPVQNPAWWDLLARGRDSEFARWFDVDWSQGPLVLPMLGDDVDLDQAITIEPSTRTASGLELHYFEHVFPVAEGTGLREGETVRDVLGRQHYRLASYRAADNELNYRRFFAVTQLAGLRVEDPAVFDATHGVLLAWVDRGDITGLRVDHPDGLVHPHEYLERLRQRAPTAWITVEKILEPGEELPREWPVAGTTGYDALTEISQVLTPPSAAAPLTALYREITGDSRDFAAHMADGKRMVATGILAAEIARLVRLVPDVPDMPRAAFTSALTELAVAFPVYRSYMPAGANHLDQATELALRRAPEIKPALEVVLPRLRDPADELCARFQQVTGAVMAKGVEDTAFYRYTRALWLNEVGGDPGVVGESLERFHEAQIRRQAHAPHGMVTVSTHDTKRGEDVRARMAVLAERPEAWAASVRRLHAKIPIADPALGLLLWQTFVGAGFLDRERMHAYLEKSMREASTGTSWRNSDPAFESALHAAVDAGYDDPEVHEILAAWVDEVALPGWTNALSQKLISLTMPGVPDVYQGTELWDDSLVDPDNRRPVDFAARRALLEEVDGVEPTPGLDEKGAIKLRVVARALRMRRDHPELFLSYRPLRATGPAAEHLIAYDRGGAITLATRLPVGLATSGGWTDTTLSVPARQYQDVITGAIHEGSTLDLTEVLRTYPVALLVPV